MQYPCFNSHTLSPKEDKRIPDYLVGSGQHSQAEPRPPGCFAPRRWYDWCGESSPWFSLNKFQFSAVWLCHGDVRNQVAHFQLQKPQASLHKHALFVVRVTLPLKSSIKNKPSSVSLFYIIQCHICLVLIISVLMLFSLVWLFSLLHWILGSLIILACVSFPFTSLAIEKMLSFPQFTVFLDFFFTIKVNSTIAIV